jgi:Zn-dependent protease
MKTRRDSVRWQPVRPSPVFLAVVGIAIIGGAVAWTTELGTTRAKFAVFLLVIAGWVVSICLHEFMHAFIAWRAGDRDVEARGYLTLNPLKYSHPLLSIGLPLLFIALGGIGLPGGAVYIRPGQFSTRTQRLISVSGPAANAVLAVILLAVVRLFADDEHYTFWFGMSFLAFLQVTAALLNLLPVPGTDGYAILEPSLSYDNRRALEQFKPYGMLILMALLFLPPVNMLFFDAVYALFELSGIPSSWASAGGTLTQFWR